MLDINTAVTLIGSVGFPIVACIAMFKQMNTQAENHKKEMDELRKSLDGNTNILTRLYEKLGGENH